MLAQISIFVSNFTLDMINLTNMTKHPRLKGYIGRLLLINGLQIFVTTLKFFKVTQYQTTCKGIFSLTTRPDNHSEMK